MGIDTDVSRKQVLGADEEAVRMVFRWGYELAKDDMEAGVYNIEEATGHCLGLYPCRRLVQRLMRLRDTVRGGG